MKSQVQLRATLRIGQDQGLVFTSYEFHGPRTLVDKQGPWIPKGTATGVPSPRLSSHYTTPNDTFDFVLRIKNQYDSFKIERSLALIISE